VSAVVGKEPCPDCGSRDNLVRYDDGHGYCFGMGCGRYEHGTGEKSATPRSAYVSDLIEGDFAPIESRRLASETLRKFDYRRSTFQGQPCHAATYHDQTGVAVAQKVRLPGKKFTWVGEPKRAGLYGQHLWKEGGRKIVITEGEIDALSMAQVQDLKWPVVSVPNGAQGAVKSLAKQVDWLETFTEIVLMFDNDEPGQLAARECAELFTPGKARIATLPLKDPSDMLVAGRADEMISAMWNAKVYRPDGIVAGADLWETVTALESFDSIPYPWLELNEHTKGMRLGELVTWTAGTGIGKSTVCRELAHYLVKRDERVGYVALEESVKRTALGFMSIEMNRPLHISRPTTVEEMRAAFDATLGTDRIFLYDHWGSLEGDNLVRKIRQMVKGCGVQWVFLDHISIVVSGMESNNERKDIDVVMTRLRQLAQELNVGIHLVSHLKRTSGQSHEEGGRVSLSDLRGSGSIGHLSDIIVGLERDQQDKERPNVAKLRVLKNRFTGETGEAGALEYHRDTGRLMQADPFAEETDGGDRSEADF